MPEDKTQPGASLDGSRRAAVLLLSIGEERAAQVLKHLDPDEIHVVGEAMASLQRVSRDEVEETLAAFLQEAEQHTPFGLGTEDYLKKVLVEALGEPRAGTLTTRILNGRERAGLGALRWMEPRAIAQVIRGEHPQIVAIVLAHLDPPQAARVIAELLERIRVEALVRVANLDSVPPSAIEELGQILDRQVSGSGDLGAAEVGGLTTAAQILNALGGEVGTEVMERIKAMDAELGEALDEAMFLFENLIQVDDRGIQRLLREVSTETLVVALKGADEALRQKFFRNMSKRAAELLRDDLEAKGPVRLSEVEQAQKEILTVARQLAESGEIVLGGGDDFV
jgi:flagellar motor switch protein FliG